MAASDVLHNKKLSSENIPVKRVVVSDPSQIPYDYGTTPGGTLFSTTPGGTRIVYDRSFLMMCRKSPHAQSPLASLPVIAGVTAPAANTGSPAAVAAAEQSRAPDRAAPDREPKPAPGADRDVHFDEPQFEMDV